MMRARARVLMAAHPLAIAHGVKKRMVDLSGPGPSPGPGPGVSARRRLKALGRAGAALPRPAALALASALLAGTAGLASWADDNAPPLPPDPDAGDWGGLYIGATAGIGFGRSDSVQSSLFDAQVQPGSPTRSRPAGAGYRLGGEAGYRWQVGHVVVGAAADLAFGSAGGRASQANGSTRSNQESAVNWVSTVRGSVGFAPVDRVLLYGTAGLGLGQVTTKAGVDTPATSFAGSRSLVQPVWVAGAGAEYRIDESWSAKVEYLHHGFADQTNVSPAAHGLGAQYQSKFSMESDTVLAGLSYRFGEGGGYVEQTDEYHPRVTTATDQYLADLEYDIGFQIWLSTGSFYYKLGTITETPQISQLNYDRLHAGSGEVTWRVGHPDGLFLKGYAGVGAANGGNLKDQDFPPFVVPYSLTDSGLSGGAIGYGALDIGYVVHASERWRLSPFIGFGFIREQMNAFGCTQVGGASAICAPAISTDVQALSEDVAWNLLRVGLAGDVTLLPGLTLAGEVAWVPAGAIDGADHHWLRSDITGPIKQTGNVSGVQLETALRYRLQDWLRLGLGARYWQLVSHGDSVFQTQGGGGAQATRFSTERYGPFLQVNVRL